GFAIRPRRSGIFGQRCQQLLRHLGILAWVIENRRVRAFEEAVQPQDRVSRAADTALLLAGRIDPTVHEAFLMRRLVLRSFWKAMIHLMVCGPIQPSMLMPSASGAGWIGAKSV